MRTDTERLDWMERHSAKFAGARWTADRAVGDDDVSIDWTWFGARGAVECRTTARPDWRAAIDQAIDESESALPPATCKQQPINWLIAAHIEGLITDEDYAREWEKWTGSPPPWSGIGDMLGGRSA